MTPHTPGPWKLDGCNVLAPSSGGRYVCIAAVSDPNDTMHETEVEKATAALIAAAPDLLEALKEAISMWNIRMDIEWKLLGLPRPSGYAPHWVEKARAAIAKAEAQS